VVRCQGGANAGHTLVFGDTRLALHLVPSGVRHARCLAVLGSGMVIDPLALLEEIDALAHAGLDVGARLRISTAAHLVLPCHRLQDTIEEKRRGAGAVGTTGRGIGPAYADKAARRGVQLGVFLRPLSEARATLGSEAQFDVESMVESVLACRARLGPMLCDTTALLHDLLAAGETVLLEGAQGVLLDLDHGSYPFVTSSSCTSAGALAGSGLPPTAVRRVTGVVKAYSTRVGNGPFPSELLDDTGEELRRRGHEYGATTGRPRRCGWFDAAAVRHAARVCGFTDFALTKLDVLDGFEKLRIADGYVVDGGSTDRFPADAAVLARCAPRIQEVEGWETPTTGCRHWNHLPAAAQRYVELLQERTGVPIRLLSVGPERESTFRVP
jgi:adenylosuccinate synthase